MNTVNRVTVNLDIAVDDFESAAAEQVRPSAAAALEVGRKPSADQFVVNVRIVGSEESGRLNNQFRALEKPTNVLAFPAGDIVLPEGDVTKELGDLAICLPVVRREAQEQDKKLEAHVAHMVIHGTLHLLGYDHANDTDAAKMEALERVALDSLGFADPYGPSTA